MLSPDLSIVVANKQRIYTLPYHKIIPCKPSAIVADTFLFSDWLGIMAMNGYYKYRERRR